MRSPSRYLTWDMPMVIDAPVMNPEMTAWDRKCVSHPSRRTPTPVVNVKLAVVHAVL